MTRLKKYIVEFIENAEQWEKVQNKYPMIKSAVKIIINITNMGYKAYLVGGAIRDIVLGDEPHDVDICGNASLDEIRKMFDTYDLSGEEFGIIGIKLDGHTYEYAQFRSDGKYADGRKPETIKIEMSFKEDAARRDFSINALAIDKDGNIIDYFDGQKDIKNKIIRAVGDPEKRFEEDHLRILRAARFAAKLGFTIDKDTKAAAKKLSSHITKLSPERIKDEIIKAASQEGSKFADYILQLDELGILEIILPEITKQKGYEHHIEHHPEGAYVRKILK